MANNNLLVHLRDLHEELSGINIDLKAVDQIDDQTIDALGQLVTDASALVDQAKTLPSESATRDTIEDEHQDLLDRIINFENNHPRVSKFLTQMTDLMTMIGV
jgi:DNA polymerase III sliding clamp (beta) subunit (PCNA family)